MNYLLSLLRRTASVSLREFLLMGVVIAAWSAVGTLLWLMPMLREKPGDRATWTPKLFERVKTHYPDMNGACFITEVTKVEYVGSRSASGIIVSANGFTNLDLWWFYPVKGEPPNPDLLQITPVNGLEACGIIVSANGFTNLDLWWFYPVKGEPPNPDLLQITPVNRLEACPTNQAGSLSY